MEHKDSLQQVAYEYLFNSIIANKLQPGVPIVEQDISRALGISRTPIREALKQLESESLVWRVPGRGAFVADITHQDLEEIFSLRETLEVQALQTAINSIPDAEISEIEDLLQNLTPDSEQELYYESDRKLHDMIVKKGNNRRLMNFLNNLNAQIERMRRVAAMRDQRLGFSRQEHLEIISALRERNLEKTEQLLRQHIRNVKESVREVLNRYWMKS